jgi:hypothetical protein
MSYTLGVDMVLTGHSLGRNKLDHLLKSGEACTCRPSRITIGTCMQRI